MDFPFLLSIARNRTGSWFLQSRTMRGVLITGNLAYALANRRIDADRFAADHAGRCLAMTANALTGTWTALPLKRAE